MALKSSTSICTTLECVHDTWCEESLGRAIPNPRKSTAEKVWPLSTGSPQLRNYSNQEFFRWQFPWVTGCSAEDFPCVRRPRDKLGLSLGQLLAFPNANGMRAFRVNRFAWIVSRNHSAWSKIKGKPNVMLRYGSWSGVGIPSYLLQEVHEESIFKEPVNRHPWKVAQP